ncbi:AI-2E family transporter [Halorientalis pallida]|uniref:AI-2E family transporter n=1 Tax=Halorientalis pallida TaxID=2479928 RepID=A0A498L3M6_9EURY|nr:AI-2E family transporter [Halorientalis pallida]
MGRVNRSKGSLLGLVTALGALSLLLILPFLQFVLGAVLVAFVLYPLQRRLETVVPSRVAAFALLGLAVVGFLAPLVAIFATIADEAWRIFGSFEADAVPVSELEARIAAATGREVDLGGTIATSGQDIARALFERSPAALGTITHFVIGVALALFLVYYLLKDGADLVAWLHRTVPLPASIRRDLASELDGMIWAVLYGHVFVALVQGLIAGLGLFVVGIPNAAFWTAVMIVLAMVPLVGAIPVWGGAVVSLLVAGRPTFALGLFVYSAVVVGLTDDYLRPLAVDRYARLNPAVILVGVLGGAYAFGVMGLFFGPIVLGGLKATLTVVSENWHELETADR